ncbi:unnamed protein product [Effrenium voratum]|nr:unnamed protein product [Effrenium voratum]
MPAYVKFFLLLILVVGLAWSALYPSIASSPCTGDCRLSDVRRRQGVAVNLSCIPPGMRLAKALGDLKMAVLGENDIISQSLFKNHHWEVTSLEEMAAMARTTLPESGTFLHIGANLGYYSLLFADRGFQVLAIEPMARNQQALEGSLCLNPHLREQVTLLPLALGAPWEVACRCVIRSASYSSNVGNGFLQCGNASCKDDDSNCQVTEVISLDRVLEQHPVQSVDVVRIDVEAHECQVLAGGGSLFSRYRPKFLQVETAWLNTSKCVAAAAEQHRYRTFRVMSSTVMVAEEFVVPELVKLGENMWV